MNKVYFTLTNLQNDNYFNYFTEAKYIFRFLDFKNPENVYIRRVYVLKNMPDSEIIIDTDTKKYYADKTILGEKHDLRNPKTCDYISQFGVDLKIDNCNILQWACFYGYTQVIDRLIKLGLDLNEELLILACKGENLNSIKYLIENGISPVIKSNEPINIVSIKGNIEIVKYLISVGADKDLALLNFKLYGHQKMINLI
ncbi:ankyrin repeat protein [Moumouvirus australiensis]|uniref:Ankyrin repeat protein n=1 Tax=Moumouvirus australiensis TaxID=2109587 RepID=A0A2P1ELK5_9VIRU|nr:ankyrin repeat protein [Moumouvirus australiensis]AVL94786.1 ankyrin repeat protein [Moumouvirus australiensis]